MISRGLVPLKELSTGGHGSGFYRLYYKHLKKLTQGRDYIKRET